MDTAKDHMDIRPERLVISPRVSLALKLGIAVFILFAIVKSALFSQINVDAGYYLTAARMISDGKLPNVHYLEPYMPLVLYINSLLYLILGKTVGYGAFLALNYVFILGTVGLLATLVYKQTKDSNYAWVVALLLFLIIYYSEGSLFVLEPATLFWGVLACYLCFAGSPTAVLFSGFCISLSFFCKQYGILYACPLGLYLLYRREFVKVGLIFGGFVLGVFLFSATHLWILKLPTENFVSFFWNSSYGNRESGSLIIKIGVFLKSYAAYFLGSAIVLGLLINQYKKSLASLALKDTEATILASGLVLMLSFYFPNFFYLHYALLVVPFLFAFTAIYFYRLSIPNIWFIGIYLLFSVVLVNTSIRSILYGMNKQVRKEQLEKGKTINAFIPKGSKTYIDLDELERFRFISQLEAPYPQKYGLSFSSNLNEEQSSELISRADYVLSGRKEVQLYTLKGYTQIFTGQGVVVLKRTH